MKSEKKKKNQDPADFCLWHLEGLKESNIYFINVDSRTKNINYLPQYFGLRHITVLPQAKKGHLEKNLLRVKGKDASLYTWNLSGMLTA